MITEKICILGSTGSIGRQTLDVVEKQGMTVTALSGNTNEELLYEQALKYKPAYVVTPSDDVGKSLKLRLASEKCSVIYGDDAVNELPLLADCDTVLDAIVGIAGLKPLLNSIKAGKKIALANKESLVCGGALVRDALEGSKATILPVDSEHSAIFQSIQGNSTNKIKSIFLTASGGPFFGYSAEQLENVTVEDTLKHPNWRMGNKITVDCATMMNKGFEVIEAMVLYRLKLEQVRVVIHRQSIVHSMVEFEDNSVIAQLGLPDMRIPIQYALTYPERKESPVKGLTIEDLTSLTFYRPDESVFRGLPICKEAISRGGLYPTVVNGANEFAVDKFLHREIGFGDIYRTIEYAMDSFSVNSFDMSIDAIDYANASALRASREYFERINR